MASSSLFCTALLFCCVALGTACLHHRPAGKPVVYPDPVGFFQRLVSHIATNFVNSTQWKANEAAMFIAQVYEMAGGCVPNAHWYCWCPIGVAEWGKADSMYLTCNMCWMLTKNPRMGDVAGNGTVVAIVAEKNTTIYPSSGGAVVQDKVAFEPESSQNFVFWKYRC